MKITDFNKLSYIIKYTLPISVILLVSISYLFRFLAEIDIYKILYNNSIIFVFYALYFITTLRNTFMLGFDTYNYIMDNTNLRFDFVDYIMTIILTNVFYRSYGSLLLVILQTISYFCGKYFNNGGDNQSQNITKNKKKYNTYITKLRSGDTILRSGSRVDKCNSLK